MRPNAAQKWRESVASISHQTSEEYGGEIMRRWMLTAAGALLCGTLFFSEPASARTNFYVRVGPPASIHQVRPSARRGFVWQDGYYRWSGNRYRWVDGRFVRPPFAGARWTPGRWNNSRRGWYWTGGHWRR